jgi:hypothetical protein
MKNLILSFATLTLIGCGGGIDGSTKLSDLSVAEVKDLCNELLDDYPEKTVDCGNGFTVTVGVAASECSDPSEAPATCMGTVEDQRDCISEIYNQSDMETCSDQALPAACTRLQGCH